MDLIQEIKKEIQSANLKKAILLFLEETSSNYEFQRKANALMTRFSHNKEERLKGERTFEQAEVEFVNITNYLLVLLDDWVILLKNTQQNTLKLKSDLRPGVLHLVNCNRSKILDDFLNHYRDNSQTKTNSQFYFLCGCPNQKPDSLAERLFLEIEQINDDDLNTVISLKTKEDKDGFSRLDLKTLPFDFVNRNFEKCKTLFKTEIEKNHKLSDFNEKTLYSKIGIVFRIPEEFWEEDKGILIKYLNWVIEDSFVELSGGINSKIAPIILIFVLDFKNFDNDKVLPISKKIFDDDISTFSKLSNVHKIYSEISPINERQFKIWLRGLLEIENNEEMETLINEFNSSIPIEHQIRRVNETWFNMVAVEKFQKNLLLKIKQQSV